MKPSKLCVLSLLLAWCGHIDVPSAAAAPVVATHPAGGPAAIEKACQAFLDRVSTSGNNLTIKEGHYAVAGKDIRVRQAASFAIAPADVTAIENEPLKLGRDKPNAWSAGTPLKGAKAGGGINASFSYVPGSLVIRKTPSGAPLVGNKNRDRFVFRDVSDFLCVPRRSQRLARSLQHHEAFSVQQSAVSHYYFTAKDAEGRRERGCAGVGEGT